MNKLGNKFGLLTLLCLSALNSSNVLGIDKPAISKSQAVQKAQQAVPGKVLKVEQSKHSYRIKMLQHNGRVKSVNIDKKSGSVSKK